MLTAGLFAWAMLLMPTRPVVAGALLGLMAFKPHFMPLILLALLAGREVKALTAALGSAGTLVVASLVAFGAGPWQEFVSQLTDSTATAVRRRVPGGQDAVRHRAGAGTGR